MKTVDILIAARKRISNINNWCRGIMWNDDETRFCAIGLNAF